MPFLKLSEHKTYRHSLELIVGRCTIKTFRERVIPGNLQKYDSTNRSLLQCKTLPAHFSNDMMVYCQLNVI